MTTKLQEIEILISSVSGVSLENLYSHIRRKEYADARAAVWFIAREYLDYSYNSIARHYQRDHTTIIAGVKKINGSTYESIVKELVRTKLPEIARVANIGAKTIETWKV